MIFVTSFNRKFYNQNGKYLLESFADSKSEGKMFVAYEEMSEEELIESIPEEFVDKFIFYNLDNDEYKEWAKSLNYVTPKKFGGTAEDTCDCAENDDILKYVLKRRKSFGDPNPPNPRLDKKFMKKHVHRTGENGCHVYDWNARCVGFAAKVFAIQRAIEKLNPEMLVWVDCDSVIVDKITKNFVQEIFQGKHDGTYWSYDAFYHYGPYRENNSNLAIESGVIGFTRNGFDLVEDVYNRLIDKSFLTLFRRDDGYIWQVVLHDNQENRQRCIDLAEHVYNNKVVENSVWGKYINHLKGLHYGTLSLKNKGN